MFRLCYRAGNSPALHLLLDEAGQRLIASKHVGHLEEATEGTEGDHHLQAMNVQDMEVTALHHHLGAHHLQDDMEDDQARETATWIPTGHAHIHDQGRREGLDHVHFRLDLQVELRPEGTEVEGAGTARSSQEGPGEEARATPAILATAVEAAAEAEVDTHGGEGD